MTHIGLDTTRNRQKAEELIGFLRGCGSNPDAPVAVGAIDEDFLPGLRLGIALGVVSLPIAPIVLFGDFIRSLEYYLKQPSGSIARAVEATQIDLPERDRRRLVGWISSMSRLEDRALALFFRWSYNAD